MGDFPKPDCSWLLTKADSVKTAFIRSYFICLIDYDYNGRLHSYMHSPEFKYRNLMMKRGKPVLEFDYVDLSMEEEYIEGFTEKTSELVTYFKPMIMKRLPAVDAEELIRRSGCDSVVVRLRKHPFDKAIGSLGFNLTDSLSVKSV